MPFTTLISPSDLRLNLAAPGWVIVDCRFSLADTTAGRRAFADGHIPGAVYAHLDEDLSGPPATDSGRHPLPTPDALNRLFRRLGVNQDSQVVAYDASGGAFASRLWWMLQYMGHGAAAVLDGGWPAWLAEDGPTSHTPAAPQAGNFSGRPQPERLVVLDEVDELPLLVDARDPARYRGEVETLDPIAGHIPGAVSYFYGRNLRADGRFLPAGQLRDELSQLLGDVAPEAAAFYCGSGVTACHNLLAVAHAGLGNGRLYVGSWSEWSRTPGRPVATGDAPTP